MIKGNAPRWMPGGGLPSWPGLKGLTSRVSMQFQRVARGLADEEGISRVHLDMRICMSPQENSTGEQGAAPDG